MVGKQWLPWLIQILKCFLLSLGNLYSSFCSISELIWNVKDTVMIERFFLGGIFCTLAQKT